MMASPASRRALLCGIAALPGLSSAALASPNSDPHVAHAAAALPLWREHKATEWGWDTPSDSPPDCAASRRASRLARPSGGGVEPAASDDDGRARRCGVGVRARL